MIIDTEISVGEFVTFISYIGMLIWPMFAIGRLFNIIERGSASYERIEILLNEKTSIIETDHAIESKAVGDIDVAIDSFTYPNDKQPSL